MVGYKAFNKDMTCRGFQFEVGKTYVNEGDISICENGFHFCANPLDCLNYYDVSDSVFCEIEAIGNIVSDSENTKHATDSIKIVRLISLHEFNIAAKDFIFGESKIDGGDYQQIAGSGNYQQIAGSGNYQQIAGSGNYQQIAGSGNYQKIAGSGDYQKIAGSGDYQQIAGSGNYQKIAGSGNYQQIAGSGDCQQIAGSGNYQKIAGSGNYQKIAGSGNCQKIAGSGDYQQIAGSGNYQKIAGSGNYQQIAGSGDCQQIAGSGDRQVICSIGKNSIVSAKKGSLVTLAEYDPNGKPLCVKTRKIDGKRLKEDVFYTLKNGMFVKYNQ